MNENNAQAIFDAIHDNGTFEDVLLHGLSIEDALSSAAFTPVEPELYPPLPYLVAELETTAVSKTDEELLDLIDAYDGNMQLEAKLRVICRRELRKRAMRREQEEREVRAAENPMFGMF